MRRTVIILTLCSALAAAAASGGDGSGKTATTVVKPCPSTMEECLNTMITRYKKAGLIGLDGEWDEAIGGYRIEKFLEASAAEAAGVRVGDILVKVNGIPLTDEKASKADLENRVPGREVTVTVLRGGEPLTFKVTLIPVPADIMAREIGRHMMESHAAAAAARQE